MNMSQEAMMAQGMDETTVMATMMEEKVEQRRLRSMKMNLLAVMPWNIAPFVIFSAILNGPEENEEDAFNIGFEEDHHYCFTFIGVNMWMYFIAIVVFLFCNIVVNCCT